MCLSVWGLRGSVVNNLPSHRRLQVPSDQLPVSVCVSRYVNHLPNRSEREDASHLDNRFDNERSCQVDVWKFILARRVFSDFFFFFNFFSFSLSVGLPLTLGEQW